MTRIPQHDEEPEGELPSIEEREDMDVCGYDDLLDRDIEAMDVAARMRVLDELTQLSRDMGLYGEDDA